MEDFKKKGEDLNKSLQESRRKVAEAQKKVQELTISAADDTKAELTKAQTEEKKLKKEEREWEKKFDEFNREEKKMPWNVDTLSKEGFSKVMPTKWRVVHFIDHTSFIISECVSVTYPLWTYSYEHRTSEVLDWNPMYTHCIFESFFFFSLPPFPLSHFNRALLMSFVMPLRRLKKRRRKNIKPLWRNMRNRSNILVTSILCFLLLPFARYIGI